MKNIAVQVPRSLRDYCGDHSEIQLKARTVREALDELRVGHTSIYTSICDETGNLRRHIHLFVNSDLILLDQPSGLDTMLSPDDILTIWTAVSGG